MTGLVKTIKVLSLVMITTAAVGMVGCSNKKKADSENLAPNAMEADQAGAMGDSDSGSAMGLMTVNFPFDSFVLDSAAKQALDQNAAILKDKSSVRVQIEGHCDERGGNQYNLALGEKRADIARKYLIDKGISGERITTISFGEERPVAQGSSEGAWAKNRRDNFVVTSK